MDVPLHRSQGSLTGSTDPESEAASRGFSDAHHPLDKLGCGLQLLRIAGWFVILWIVMFAVMIGVGVFGRIFF